MKIIDINRFIFVSRAAGLPSLALGQYKKNSVGICICYRPTIRGFSHCPIYVGRQRRSPTPVYATYASGHILADMVPNAYITSPQASTVAQSLT